MIRSQQTRVGMHLKVRINHHIRRALEIKKQEILLNMYQKYIQLPLRCYLSLGPNIYIVGMATKKPVSSPGGNKPSAGGHSSKPGYRKGGRREGCSGGIREGVRVVSIDDDEYFDYAMGPYPGFSSTLSQRQRINKLVLSFAITITVISHILQN